MRETLVVDAERATVVILPDRPVIVRCKDRLQCLVAAVIINSDIVSAR